MNSLKMGELLGHHSEIVKILKNVLFFISFIKINKYILSVKVAKKFLPFHCIKIPKCDTSGRMFDKNYFFEN